jgi:hypothetical protein
MVTYKFVASLYLLPPSPTKEQNNHSIKLNKGVRGLWQKRRNNGKIFGSVMDVAKNSRANLKQ